MCAIALLLILFAPRVAVLAWWLIDSYRLLAPFGNMTVLPILGASFLPGTTLAYAAIWSPSSGPFGSGLAWLGLGLAFDVILYVFIYINSHHIEGLAAHFFDRR